MRCLVTYQEVVVVEVSAPTLQRAIQAALTSRGPRIDGTEHVARITRGHRTLVKAETLDPAADAVASAPASLHGFGSTTTSAPGATTYVYARETSEPFSMPTSDGGRGTGSDPE